MRIALIRQRYTPFGGAERFVERAIGALREQGAVVTVVARRWEHESVDRGSVEGAPQSDLQQPWIRCDPFYLGRAWRDASFARAACAAVNAGAFDLVQSHERVACCDVFRAGDGVHRQWLAHRSRVLGPLARLGQALNPYHRYVLSAERRMFESARLRAVICNSRMVRDDVRRHFDVAEDKLHVIYNGVDTERFHPGLREAHRRAQRHALGIAQSVPVYLFVGSGFERKGIPVLLRAFAATPMRDARLAIVGRDRLQARMQSLAARLGIADRVSFAGPQADVRPWYGMADCFVLPTLYDPMPNAALEAFACGLPVITSRQSGAAELVRGGENGFVGDALDVAGLARALEAATDLRDDRARAAARETVRALTLGAMAGRLVELYRRLLAR